MGLEQFERIMELYFDVHCEIVHEDRTNPALIERARRKWLYSKPTTLTSSITLSGSSLGNPWSKHEVRVTCDDLNPRVIKRILTSFGVSKAAFLEACDCEGCCVN